MYSFDIFDTLLTRTTATPDGIFTLMQQELQNNQIYQTVPDLFKKNFFYLRKNAEDLANYNYRNNDVEEITLEQIYQSLKVNGDVSDTDIQLLINLENSVELSNAIGIRENIDKVKNLIAQNEHVVLISDMYLDKETIHTMLMKADSVFKNIKLYISSDYKKCKWSGNLFRVVKGCERVEFNEWTHTGDNTVSDIDVPNSFGIKTQLYNFEKLKPYEYNALVNRENDFFMQLTIGVARNARLFYHLSDVPAGLGASLGGPMLVPYVWWILQNCNQKGIKRLYFIARDGYILKVIADKIIASNNYDIQTNYIYGSRKVWRMPSINKNNNDIENITVNSYLKNVLTVKDLAELFELSLKELYEFFDLLGNIDPEEYISEFIRNYITKTIKYGKDELVMFLDTKHKKKKELVIKYLKQEIDFSDSNFAFVEMAGSGLTQACLAEICREFYPNSLQTFYFKLDSVKARDNCIFYNFFPSLLKHHIAVETLTRAPHGQTVGYIDESNKVLPVLDDSEGFAIIKHGFYEYLDGIIKFTGLYLKNMSGYLYEMDKLDVLIYYLKYIMETPDREILDFIGGMPNKVTGREKEIVEFAPILTEKDIRNIYLLRGAEPLETYYKGTDFEYSLLRSGEKINKKVSFYSKKRNTLVGNTLSFIYNKKKKTNNYQDFPVSVLKEKIAIYAAGKYGQALYNKLNGLCNVVLWVDQNYDEYSKIGFAVSSIDMINKVEFDQIVIAMRNEINADKVRTSLIEMGIPNSKILWVNFLIK